MNEKNQTIVIQITGDETIATRIPTGWPGDSMIRAHAKRHADDAFDAYTGARLVLDRLFGKAEERVEEDTPKRVKRFRPGDIVRIVNPIPPTWEDYEEGDIAEVLDRVEPARLSPDWFYNIRVRSKGHKGNEARVLGQELELVHRPEKKGGAKR